MTVKRDNQLIGFMFVISMFSVGIYYLLPMIYVNPYEYFYGGELKSYQLYHLFFSGVMIPVTSLITGFIITRPDYDRLDVLKKLLMIFIVLFIISLLFNGFIGLFIVPMSGIVVLFFRDKPVIISVITSFILLGLYFVVWTIIPALVAANSNNIIYSSIQQLNNYLGVYRESDIISMIELNIQSIFTINFFDKFLFLSLPLTFIGSMFHRVNIEDYFKQKGTILVIVTIISGLIIKMMEILSLGSKSGRLIGDNIGGVIMSLGLFLLLILLVQRLPKMSEFLFENIGVFSLTMFTIFNLIMATIFYGFGLNYYGEVKVGYLVIIILIIILVIFGLSMLLRKTKFRPLIIISNENHY